MAIQISVQRAELVQCEDGTSGLAVVLRTTNDAYPGTELKASQVYATTKTPAEIQAAINSAVSLLWQAHGLPSWTV